MLEEDFLLSLPTEEDLPDCDEKPVDNELQILAPALLRGIRLSYLVYREGVMPQWVLEVVSQTPGGEYDTKFKRYAEMGVLYYTIYNPSHTRRDRSCVLEVYRLEKGVYVQQGSNPVWMPELGLGIGHERGIHEGMTRDWLYWYDEAGTRYPAPNDVLSQERILRKREQLMRIEMEESLAQEERSRILAEQALEQEERSRILAEQALEQERILSANSLEQERRSIALNLLGQGIPVETIAQATGLTIAQVQSFQGEL